jgi:hypothetical protein
VSGALYVYHKVYVVVAAITFLLILAAVAQLAGYGLREVLKEGPQMDRSCARRCHHIEQLARSNSPKVPIGALRKIGPNNRTEHGVLNLLLNGFNRNYDLPSMSLEIVPVCHIR